MTQLSASKSVLIRCKAVHLKSWFIGVLLITNPLLGQTQSAGTVVAWGYNFHGATTVPDGLTNVTAIAAAIGGNFNLCIKADKTVVAWGDNAFHQTEVPSGLTNVIAVAGGGSFEGACGGGQSMALKTDGTVEVWGSAKTPIGLSNVLAIAAGAGHGLALKNDGTVYAWGANFYGEAAVPSGLSNVVAIAAGGDRSGIVDGGHSLALKSDGTVVAWGRNDFGQANVPQALTDVIAITAGAEHSLALKADGTVVGWGLNWSGQTDIPDGASNVVAIAAGWGHSVALRTDGTVISWGTVQTPEQLGPVAAIAAGYYHNIALQNDGSPFLARQPLNSTVYEGRTARLSVGALGTPSVAYQWLFNGMSLPGATNATLVLENVQFTNNGSYQVVVTNVHGAILSSNAFLSVVPSAPIIVDQPGNQVAIAGSALRLEVTSLGSLPMSYQWRLNQTNIFGETNSFLLFTNLNLANEGGYDLVLSNAYGVVTSSNFFLNVIDVSKALNTSNLTWTTTGRAPWRVQTTVSHDGVACLESGHILDGEQLSKLQTTVTGPGTLSFWWNVEAQEPGDYLSFSINQTQHAHISGNPGWQQLTVYLGNGTQTLEWAYVKTDAFVRGHDAGWVDEVNFVPGGTAPFLTLKPAGQIVPLGTEANLTSVALGTPPIFWQWQLNSTNLDGSTNAVLTITNAEFQNEGYYSLILSNAFGLTNAGPVYLDVVDVAQALNATNLTWTSAGSEPWFVQTDTTHDGVAALQSGLLSDGQVSTLETAVNGPGTLGFWCSTRSWAEQNFLTFSIDGIEQDRIPGIAVWTPQTYYLTSGVHTLNWTYFNNHTTGGGDAGWVDEVSFFSGITPAFIERDPTNQVVSLGSPASLAIVARGTPPLGYQWLFNGKFVPNATNAILTIPDVKPINCGAYSVIVSNDYGHVVSREANLSLLNIVGWGAGTTRQSGVPWFGQGTVPTNLIGLVAVAGGGYHSLALASDGKVYSWGYNGYNECSAPASLTNAAAIAAGLYDSLALRRDGTAIGWGRVGYGALPVPAGATNLQAIAAGWYHNLALRSNGTVIAWGAGTSKTANYLPYVGQSIVPTNLTNVVAVAAGGYHSLALRNDGKVIAWGWNAFGQTNVPVDLSGVIAIAAGGSNSLALRRDGTVVGWGDNTHGQTNIPAGLSNVVAISAGAAHNLALKSDGTVVSWGLNGDGQTNLPASLTNVAAISAGGYHSVALVNVGPVTFLSSPQSITAFKTDPINLAPALLGAMPISYQWLHNGALLDDATNASLLIVSAQGTDAGTYQLVASNLFGAATGAVAAVKVYDTAPSFTQQPCSLSVSENSNAALGARVAGVPPLALQWFFNGIPLPAATNTAFTITNAQLANEGVYYLVASNAQGTATSSNAFLDVIDLRQALGATNLIWTNSGLSRWYPELTNTHDGIAAASAGPLAYNQPAVLQTTVSGPGTLSFRWADSMDVTLQFAVDGTNVDTWQQYYSSRWGTDTFYLTPGTHTLRWTANAYSWNTGLAFLDELVYSPGATAPLILGAPANQTSTAGQDVGFDVTAGGTPPLSYQWYFNGAVLPGETTHYLGIANVQSNNNGTYTVAVTNTYGATNASSVLVVNPSAPFFLTPASDREMVPGGTATFTVSARGSDPLSYQWQFNGTDIPGATASSLFLFNVQANDAGSYRVVAANSYGTITSSNATLTLVPSVIVGWGQVFTSSPNPPLGLTNVSAISGGDDFSAALRTDGTVCAWGWDAFGKLNIPAGLSNVCAISTGNLHGSALINNGTVVDWGDSFFDAAAIVPPGLSNMVRVAAGDEFNLALKQDGTVVSWGYDAMKVFSPPAGLSNVVDICAGWNQALALRRNGTVVTWGYTTALTEVPVGLTNVVAIAAGWNHCMALKSDGSVVVWGDRFSGVTNVPPELSNVIAIAAGSQHCLALRADGTVIAWGLNLQDQTAVPFRLTNVVAIAGGGSHSLALLNDGSPYIVRQPWSQTVMSGAPVDFTVLALGQGPLTYQWQVNGTNIAGADSAVLSVPGASLADSGNYQCLVSNAVGVTRSLPAVVTVLWSGPHEVPTFGRIDTNGDFNLFLNNLSGHGPVIILGSTNLIEWRGIVTNPPATNPIQFMDPQVPKLPYRFYRAVEQ